MRISDGSSDVCSSDLAEASHRLLMTPQPDPIDAPPPPGPPYRRGHEPMFTLPPGTLWLALAIVAMFGLQTLLEGPSWSSLLNTFAFVSTRFWPPGAPAPTAAGELTLVTHAFLRSEEHTSELQS